MSEALAIVKLAFEFLESVIRGEVSDDDVKIVGTEIRQAFARYVKTAGDAAEIAKFGPSE